MKYTLILLIVLGACAKHTNEIPAQYTSPMQYQSYTCKQMEMEMRTLSRRISEVGGVVDKTASDDSAQMGVGLILFWPVLFALDGDTPQAAEYGRLKGEFDALEHASIQKNCGFTVERPVIQQPKDETPKRAFPGHRL